MSVNPPLYKKVAKVASQFKAHQLQEVNTVFKNFLKKRKQRQTPERFTILEEIYLNAGHFDADELYLRLKKNGHHISRATVYNTLELLLECNLVVKHQFGHTQAKYERAYNYRQHDHLICQDCGHVLEYCDPRIQTIREMVAEIYNFEITQHSLHMYGHCKTENCEFATANAES